MGQNPYKDTNTEIGTPSGCEKNYIFVRRSGSKSNFRLPHHWSSLGRSVKACWQVTEVIRFVGWIRPFDDLALRQCTFPEQNRIVISTMAI